LEVARTPPPAQAGAYSEDFPAAMAPADPLVAHSLTTRVNAESRKSIKVLDPLGFI